MEVNLMQLLPLSNLKKGEHATLHEIHTDRNVACRLSSLGFTPGVDIEMTQNYGFGPLVVTVRSTRIALGREEASRTMVQKDAQ